MSTYIEVPLAAIQQALESRGFTQTKVGHEIVFSRPSKTNPNLVMEVFSSISEGSMNARKVGKDAIRVVLASKDPKKGKGCGLFSKRVYRVTSVQGVIDRTLTACVEAAEKAKGFQKVCPYCGAAAYTDTGRCTIRSCRETKRTGRKVEIRGNTYAHRQELGRRGFEWNGEAKVWTGTALLTDEGFLKTLTDSGCTVTDLQTV